MREIPVVAGVHDPRSIGVRGYVERLSAALADIGVEYRPTARGAAGELCHFHLANSTRAVVAQAVRQRRGFLLTVHDVVPRTSWLLPLHRAVIVPLCIRRAELVIVHSRHAAKLLAQTGDLPTERVVIVPLPATVPAEGDRDAARGALGLSLDGPPLFVLPGTLKPAKLVGEALLAAQPLVAAGRARLLLAGRVGDERLAAAATAAGAILLSEPGALDYERAVVAADVVMCLRGDSVGESNGPLLEAIGAGRPALVTDVGSAPEVAAGSAVVVAPTTGAIRSGIETLLDEDERAHRATCARALASALTWASSARRHAELFAQVARG